MAIIVIFHEASGKKKIRMASYRISWNQADHQKSTERTEQGLPDKMRKLVSFEVIPHLCYSFSCKRKTNTKKGDRNEGYHV